MQQPYSAQPGWRVLLIGGNTGAGKTVMGEALASRFDRSLLLVDDFRMMIQEMTTLAEQPGIHYFLAHPTIWQKPPEVLCEGFIAVGNALIRPLSVVIAHHVCVESAGPVILEGDGILPALAARRSFANKHFTPANVTNEVRSVFLIESHEEAILENMRQRGRGFESFTLREQETLVRASWLYGQWLRQQAEQYGLPALEARPWETLMERVLHALGN
jgi:2-phosphoglycerate kinase